MKLHWSPRSPFVRQVMIVIHELGLTDRIEYTRSVVAMTRPNIPLMADNPLSKIPTLVLADGEVLYDSRVISEYLCSCCDDRKLFPADAARFTALRRHALGDGLLDLLVLWRNEYLRPENARSQPLIDAFELKYAAVMKRLEAEADAFAATGFSIGDIAIGCALSYLDFRFGHLHWREQCPRLAVWHAAFEARPSVMATAIIDDS
ncbi:MAG: glutathione S-transferase family protein [Gammaproteobacteria bacterium]|nr:glutathione S-transferase family protein [Gammaproteobacteria bacterium]